MITLYLTIERDKNALTLDSLIFGTINLALSKMLPTLNSSDLLLKYLLNDCFKLIHDRLSSYLAPVFSYNLLGYELLDFLVSSHLHSCLSFCHTSHCFIRAPSPDHSSCICLRLRHCICLILSSLSQN